MSDLAVDVAPDAQECARRAASFACGLLCAPQAIGAVCLAGGATPRPLYEMLARDPFASRIPWSRVHWFFGDERFVPPDDPRSNARMVAQALFSRAPVPPQNVHAVPTSGLPLKEAARRYEQDLRAFYGAERLDPSRPLFDLVVLGLGADGHTASLLPGRQEIEERERWVAPVPQGGAEPRITLTPPVLESARAVAFVVCGAEKRAAFAKLRAGDQSIPAAHVRPSGPLFAFVDGEAAE